MGEVFGDNVDWDRLALKIQLDVQTRPVFVVVDNVARVGDGPSVLAYDGIRKVGITEWQHRRHDRQNSTRRYCDYSVNEGRPRSSPLRRGSGFGRPLRISVVSYTLCDVSETVTLSPLTGSTAAAMAWHLDRSDLDFVIPPGAPEGVLQEVRSQFAAWCSAQPRSLFADLASAWEAFIAPREGMAAPAVRLPGTTCPSCSERRVRTNQMQRVAFANCQYCRGIGHLPPRAIPARSATREFGIKSAVRQAAS